jgi:hypothetical protein
MSILIFPIVGSFYCPRRLKQVRKAPWLAGVAERIGERLQGRLQHLGREMLCYGIDRESYLLGQRQEGQEALLAS